MNLNCVREPAKSCPRCQSERVYRSHRRAALDRILYTLGAEIRRCRDCRFRHAAFVRFALPLEEAQTLAGIWAGVLVVGSGFLVCLLFVWWMIQRISDLPG